MTMLNIKTQVTSPSAFDKTILELLDGDKFIGYIHEENPTDPGELYVVFQESPSHSGYADQKKGLKLKEFVPLLQRIFEKEIEMRSQSNARK